MLLYVNKKQQRRKRIKLVSLILFCVFVVLANIIHFNNALHKSDKNLTDYTPITFVHNWYNSAQNITLFSSSYNPSEQIIIIPSTINRETSLTLAYAFSKISSAPSLEFTQEVPNTEFLAKLVSAATISQKKASTTNLLITTDSELVRNQILDKKLYPTVINYQQAKKITNNKDIMDLINNSFPLPKESGYVLDKQQNSLQKFISAYQKNINPISPRTNIQNLSLHGFLLQNISLCLQTPTAKFCSINNSNSFQKNLSVVLKQIDDYTKITKLTLLTSSEEISPNTLLKPDEGIIFKYGIKEQLLLPSEVTELIQKQQNPYLVIKQLAGYNYQYNAADMKFYKFKIVEIDINDKI